MTKTFLKGCLTSTRKIARDGGLKERKRRSQKQSRMDWDIQMIAAAAICFAILGAMGIACTTARAQTDQIPTAWGNAVNGLQIAIYFDPSKAQGRRPDDVMLALKNVGTEKIVVGLGGGCGNFSRTNNVVFFLTDREGKTQEVHDLSGPQSCAGALGVFSVPLSPGAVYTIPVNLFNYGQVLQPDSLSRANGEYVAQAGLLGWLQIRGGGNSR